MTSSLKPKPKRRPRPAWLPSPAEAKVKRAAARACERPELLRKLAILRVANGEYGLRSVRRAKARAVAAAEIKARNQYLLSLTPKELAEVIIEPDSIFFRRAWPTRKVVVALASAFLAFAVLASGCSPGGGELRLSRHPFRAYSPSAPLVIEGPGSASVPVEIESVPAGSSDPDSHPAPSSGVPTTRIEGAEVIESRR